MNIKWWASILGLWISNNEIPIWGSWILKKGNPISAPIFGRWISNPNLEWSIFDFMISIPASIFGPWILSDGTPILDPYISNPSSIFKIFIYF